MTVLAIVDAWLPLLPVTDPVEADDTGAEPTNPLPFRLYLWPRRAGAAEQRLEEDRGRFPEAVLKMRGLYTVGARAEVRGLSRDRGTTQLLDDAMDAIVKAVHNNRHGDLWWDTYIEAIAYDAVRTVDVRGYGWDMAVRLNDPPVLDFGGVAP